MSEENEENKIISVDVGLPSSMVGDDISIACLCTRRIVIRHLRDFRRLLDQKVAEEDLQVVASNSMHDPRVQIELLTSSLNGEKGPLEQKIRDSLLHLWEWLPMIYSHYPEGKIDLLVSISTASSGEESGNGSQRRTR